MNVLLVDVGNTRIKWRVADVATGRGVDGTPVDVPAVASLADRFGGQPPVGAAFVSAVAGAAVEAAVVAAIGAAWPGVAARTVLATAREGTLVNGYREPALLGPDRWLAAIGAHARLGVGPLLVCTFGTATTIDLVDDDADHPGGSRFVGGMILPGFETMRRSLVDRAALLSGGHGQDLPFGDRRDDAIAGGLVAAQAGAVLYALDRAAARSTRPRVVVAGGDAARVATALAASDVATTPLPDAVMIGLAIVAGRRLGDPVAAPAADGAVTPDRRS